MRLMHTLLGLTLLIGSAMAQVPVPLIAVEPVGATRVRLTISASTGSLHVLRPRVGQLSTFASWAGWSLEVRDAAGARWLPVAIPGTPVAPRPWDVIELHRSESWGVLISLAGFTERGAAGGTALAATPGRYRISVRYEPGAETLAAVQPKGAPPISPGPFRSPPRAIDFPARSTGAPPSAPQLRLLPLEGTTVRVWLDHHGPRPMHVVRPRSTWIERHGNWVGWRLQVNGNGRAWGPVRNRPGPAPMFFLGDVVQLRPGESCGADVNIGDFGPSGSLKDTAGEYSVKVRYAPEPGQLDVRRLYPLPMNQDGPDSTPPGPKITSLYGGPVASGTVIVRVPR